MDNLIYYPEHITFDGVLNNVRVELKKIQTYSISLSVLFYLIIGADIFMTFKYFEGFSNYEFSSHLVYWVVLTMSMIGLLITHVGALYCRGTSHILIEAKSTITEDTWEEVVTQETVEVREVGDTFKLYINGVYKQVSSTDVRIAGKTVIIEEEKGVKLIILKDGDMATLSRKLNRLA